MTYEEMLKKMKENRERIEREGEIRRKQLLEKREKEYQELKKKVLEETSHLCDGLLESIAQNK